MSDDQSKVESEGMPELSVNRAANTLSKHPPVNHDLLLGCEHYKRKCKFVTPCCDKVYSCRFCHDASESHSLQRKSVTKVQCSNCLEIQPVQKECSNCRLLFGKYFCAECKLYDDEDKKQYHCLGCGICRVGGQERFFHCQKCDMCLPKKLEDNHQCIENMSRGNCPICMEDIHTSRIPSHIPSCGHLIHRTCFDALVRGGHYACPVCQKSMLNMESVWRSLDEEIAATPMPPEYANYFIGILCKDCHQESSVRFHPVGAKCRSCGSYNTCRSSNPELFTEPPEVATRRGTGFGEVIRVSHGRGRANSEPVVETSDGSVNSSEETGDS
ncbi:RING finger and CHY zinc finger domain-containing protein 1-like [Artemia franciscana]|uniref:RING finger and CHY zinc finger domain-containing protein 1-like n=2 Tax=Artemia franciscana TaxID=6661 RepID=UPI0032DBDDF9